MPLRMCRRGSNHSVFLFIPDSFFCLSATLPLALALLTAASEWAMEVAAMEAGALQRISTYETASVCTLKPNSAKRGRKCAVPLDLQNGMTQRLVCVCPPPKNKRCFRFVLSPITFSFQLFSSLRNGWFGQLGFKKQYLCVVFQSKLFYNNKCFILLCFFIY